MRDSKFTRGFHIRARGNAMGSYTNKAYTCPFFQWAEKRAIHCEGGRIGLPDSCAQNGFERQFCAGEWKRCGIARSLLLYYDEERDGRT